MKARRRTKKAYANLYDHPAALFGNGPDNAGPRVTLWPNGENELWIQDASGRHSVKITASSGPAGLGITLRRHFGATPITLRAYNQDYKSVLVGDLGNVQESPVVDDVVEVCLTMYNADDRSQAFKRWYDRQETNDDITLLGPEYMRAALTVQS